MIAFFPLKPPGVPDNITPSPNGGFFVGVVAVENDVEGKYLSIPAPLRLFRDYPFLKTGLGNFQLNLMSLVSKIDEFYASHFLKTVKHFVGHLETGSKLAPPHAMIVELDGQGNVVQSFHGTDGSLKAVCEGFAFGDWLYLGSPFSSQDGVARVPLR